MRHALFLPLALIAALALPTLAGAPDATAVDREVKVKPRKRPKARRRAPRKGGKAGKAGKTRGTLITKFESGTPMWTVRQAFHCVLDFDESSGFDCYAPLNVEINRHNKNALTHLRKYQWTHFRKYAASYVAQGNTFGLYRTRVVPSKITPETSRVKLFFFSRHRDNPAPMTLKREGGTWKIYNNSL